MRITLFSEAIWPCIEASVGYLQEHRKEPLTDLVSSGLNFSIILGSACYVEGVLEMFLRAILEQRREEFNGVTTPDIELGRSVNMFYGRMETDLAEDIGRATGTDRHNEMFALLAGVRLNELVNVKPLWEGITVLFQFRNVMGHGREVSARQYFGGVVPGGSKEEFRGGYRAVEDYLHKKRLLDRRFFDAHSEFLYLGPEIADHFWELAQKLPDAVMTSLPDSEQQACHAAMADVISRASAFKR